jgi:hypothetical protein
MTDLAAPSAPDRVFPPCDDTIADVLNESTTFNNVAVRSHQA